MARARLSLEAFESSSQDWLVHLVPRREVSRQEYRAFVAANPELRIERTARGEVIVMPPAHSRTGYRNGELFRQLANWARQDGSGAAFDSSAGFDLPDGSNRSPDASWILKSRLATLTPEERSEYLPLCPDFVAELRSKSDRLSAVREKMIEYLDNGAKLGWLIDPLERRVHVYRAGAGPQILVQPAAISGDPDLPGFTLDLERIWDPEV